MDNQTTAIADIRGSLIDLPDKNIQQTTSMEKKRLNAMQKSENSMMQSSVSSKFSVTSSQEDPCLEDFNVIKEIGKGSYGKVFKVEFRNKIYALKQVSKELVQKSGKVHAIFNERDAMQNAHSPYIPEFSFAFQVSLNTPYACFQNCNLNLFRTPFRCTL